ncbi:hypothetical protein [Novosphingobium gossypii]|uniref:hypothetical protein n=1 Tax=Novosphingobium gossypii TaxID=1604774 RepID=UPI003D1FB332
MSDTETPAQQDAPVRRVVEPFVYFREHASAIPGLGGRSRSPNPNYCFHTNYFEYLSGVVVFHVFIRNARATRGEMEIRVHGYRPDNPDLGIKLVTGARIPLAEIDENTLTVQLRISAIPGVHYALFAHYTDPADLQASAIDIEAEEWGGETAEDYNEGVAPDSVLGMLAPEAAGSLVARRQATLTMPGSQPCTQAQLDSDIFRTSWPQVGPAADALSRWRQVYALEMLRHFGFLNGGGSVLLLGEAPAAFEDALHAQDCLIALRSPAEVANPDLALKGAGYFDIVVCLDVSSHCRSREDIATFIKLALRRLMRGGMAVLIFDYTDLPMAGGSDDDAPVLKREHIEQIALRVIGHGSTLVQLAFPSGTKSDILPADRVAFGFAVRR